MADCQWPFWNQPACAECATHEAAYGVSVDHYLEALAESRAALKASRGINGESGRERRQRGKG